MTDRSLLVLGASRYQLDVIRRARERGLRVVVADNEPTNPGHLFADASHVVSTRDADGIERVARAESVAGVIAPCTDVAVPAAATVAARLGLPGVPSEIADLVTSKSEFRRWQREAGLPSPRTFSLNGGAATPLPGRLIVKPDRSSGSKGTRIVEREDELADALRAANELDSEVIAEQVIEGDQVTVEGFVREGKIEWAIVLDRQTAPAPWVATTGHRLPTRLSEDRAALAVGAVAATLETLGLSMGPFDADLVVGGEAVVLEVSPRLGGNSIVPLVELSTGVNLPDIAIDTALGEAPPAMPTGSPDPAAVLLLGAARAGSLDYDRAEADALRLEPWVSRLDLEDPGVPVRQFVDGGAAIGLVLITGADRDEIDDRAEQVLRRLAILPT